MGSVMAPTSRFNSASLLLLVNISIFFSAVRGTDSCGKEPFFVLPPRGEGRD